jgi:hypothetical protein
MINALIFSIFLIYCYSFVCLCNTSCWVTAFITHKLGNKFVHNAAFPWIYVWLSHLWECSADILFRHNHSYDWLRSSETSHNVTSHKTGALCVYWSCSRIVGCSLLKTNIWLSTVLKWLRAKMQWPVQPLLLEHLFHNFSQNWTTYRI